MVDVFTKTKRSEVMSNIRGRNTKPELLIRKALFNKGFRYRLHVRNLPGKPDLVLPDYNAVIFIHGCFWHRHDCHLFKWPSTRPDFWKSKINRNQAVDLQTYRKLKKDGWYILTIWECALKGKTRRPLNNVIDNIEYWLLFETRNKQIKGKKC
jgi:DNA mismatch endonuclease, patch repair protein